MDRFLGEPISYWIDLKKLIESNPNALEVEHLLKELIAANAKVRYYEMQIERMNAYREAV